MLRISYDASGMVTDTEVIRGYPLLVESTRQQLKSIHIQTNRVDDHPCQSLLVIDYRLSDEETPPAVIGHHLAGGAYINVTAHNLVISDPAFTITRTRRKFLGLF